MTRREMVDLVWALDEFMGIVAAAATLEVLRPGISEEIETAKEFAVADLLDRVRRGGGHVA